MLRPRNAGAEMREDQIVPPVMRNHPVGAGEIDADRPFLGADFPFKRRDLDAVERLHLGTHAAVDVVDAVHAGTSCLSGCAAANASSLLALSSIRSNVGNSSRLMLTRFRAL